MEQQKPAARPLALLYAALIVYASLYPFTGWRDRGLSPFAFLPAPFPKYWTWFDLITNFIGYAPFGFLLTLVLLSWSLRRGWAALLAFALAALLSLTMESLQSYLPQRVASNVDLALNAAGALAGALAALALERVGAIDYGRRLRAHWFERESRGALVLLGLWPVGLLFPPPIAFGLGQVAERLYHGLADLLQGSLLAPWLPAPPPLTPLAPWQELLCVTLGLLAPCLLGHTAVRPPARRIALAAFVLVVGFAVAALSAALTWGPPHAWAWLDNTVTLALVLALLAQLALLNSTPVSSYAVSTLQEWEEGRFIHFHGLAQWVGWLWPFLTLAYWPARLLGRGRA